MVQSNLLLKSLVLKRRDDTAVEDFVALDFTKNRKQSEFLKTVKRELLHRVENKPHNGYRYFFYGGAIRGGKTTVCLYLMMMAAALFKNFRGHVIRATGTVLQTTTIPSFRKIVPPSLIKKWTSIGSSIICVLNNNSEICFYPEMVTVDKDFDRFKGLETNWIMMEQLEELQQKTFEKAKERVGSWQATEVPVPGFILSTFNPTFTWVKEEIYEKHRRGELHAPYYYLTALPSDNPYVTNDQWDSWKEMDTISYRRFIDGDWDVKDNSGLFFANFDYNKHTAPNLTIRRDLPIVLSFDFNINPMSCLMIQHSLDKRSIRVIREFKGINKVIGRFLVEDVKPHLPVGIPIHITGDPSGFNRSTVAVDERTTNFKIISDVLNIPKQNVHTAPAPSHRNSYVHINAFLERFPDLQVDSSCINLIRDFMGVQFKGDHIDKSNADLTHFSDCFRYYVHLYFKDFVKYPTKLV